MKDVDRILMPQDPLLDLHIPRPLVERGECGGVWEDLETQRKDEDDDNLLHRDCYGKEYSHSLSQYDSKVFFFGEDINLFTVS